MNNQANITSHSVVAVLYSAENGEYKVYLNDEVHDCYYTADSQEAVQVARETCNYEAKISRDKGEVATFSIKHSNATAEQEMEWCQ